MTFRAFDEAEAELLREVIESQEIWRHTSGNFVARFEDAFAEHTGRKYVHAVCSGTSANEAALAGLGIGPGDEVICPPCSFIASSMAAVALGAIPVFADVDPRTLIITAEDIEKAITPNAKAVVVVHLWGQPAEMDPILEVCRKHDLAIAEDCAQAYDAYYKGRMVGTFGDVASYSLQQSKHITAGEGGIVTTDDPEVYKRAVLYSNCGMPWYRYGLEWPRPQAVGGVPTRGHFAFGHNHRMTELQGAVALAQLGKIDGFNARRQEAVAALEAELEGVEEVALAHRYADTQPNYWAYPLRLVAMPAAELSRLCLERHDIALGRYQEVNYLEACYQEMNAARRTSLGCPLPDYVRYDPGTCPKAEDGGLHIVPIGVHHSVAPEGVRHVGRAIREVLASWRETDRM